MEKTKNFKDTLELLDKLKVNIRKKIDLYNELIKTLLLEAYRREHPEASKVYVMEHDTAEDPIFKTFKLYGKDKEAEYFSIQDSLTLKGKVSAKLKPKFYGVKLHKEEICQK